MTGSSPVKRRRRRRVSCVCYPSCCRFALARPPSGSRAGAPCLVAGLAYALDDKGPAGRVVEPAGQDFLVFRGIVPAPERRFVGEFDENDAFGLRSALDQFGGAAPCQEAAAIL